MSSRRYHPIKILLIFSLLISVLSGCGLGFPTASISDSFPLESVNQDGSQSSYVYRAENQTVPEVASQLAEQRKPKEISKEDTEHMFLVYPDELYHLQIDPNQPEDTLIEVNNKEYVRQNYAPSFLEGYLLASVLDDVFDLYKYKTYGNYKGYSTKDIYKPKTEYRIPTDQDRKIAPPITVNKAGSIIKRGSNSSSVSVGSDGNILKKSTKSESITDKIGKIIKDKQNEITSNNQSKSKSTFTPRKSKAPKVRVGGFGKIRKRR